MTVAGKQKCSEDTTTVGQQQCLEIMMALKKQKCSKDTTVVGKVKCLESVVTTRKQKMLRGFCNCQREIT